MAPRGKWHGAKRYFGLHYDLHAGTNDTDLGAGADPEELARMFDVMGADFVQTDCKGHAGYTSWFSTVENASVSPGVVKDAMQAWREATRLRDLPLHCHYSGVWDRVAGANHPEWCILDPEGAPASQRPAGQNAGAPVGEKMCPLRGYADELMIPQMLELVDRYGVDGFWIDGDIWAMSPCWCPECRAAFAEETGIDEPPVSTDDPDWVAWINFHRKNYYAFVTKYCDAVHERNPDVLVCSNWLQTFRDPGEPAVPTDWISGDNAWVWGMDGSRCEARFISTRGKPWDIMLWSFYFSGGLGKTESPKTTKPPQMLMQEASVTLALGGNVQLYENPSPVRDGRLVEWRMRRMGEVGAFVKKRRTLCQGTETIPQVAVLHSEVHARAQPSGNLFWGLDFEPVQGAVFALLECHYGVDILDEWALAPRLADFPVVVAPQQDMMSDEMVRMLKRYVEEGGRLLLTGAAAVERFGADFLGVTKGKVERETTFYVPAADGDVAVWSDWRLVKPKTAEVVKTLSRSPLREESMTPHPSAVINPVGTGKAAWCPFNPFREFQRNRYPDMQRFIAEVMSELVGVLDISVTAPLCVDVVLRRKKNRRLVHLINRASGIPNRPNNGAIDEIPLVGPVTVRLRLDEKPKTISLAFEKGTLETAVKQRGAKGWTAVVCLPQVHIHSAVVVET